MCICMVGFSKYALEMYMKKVSHKEKWNVEGVCIDGYIVDDFVDY